MKLFQYFVHIFFLSIFLLVKAVIKSFLCLWLVKLGSLSNVCFAFPFLCTAVIYDSRVVLFSKVLEQNHHLCCWLWNLASWFFKLLQVLDVLLQILHWWSGLFKLFIPLVWLFSSETVSLQLCCSVTILLVYFSLEGWFVCFLDFSILFCFCPLYSWFDGKPFNFLQIRWKLCFNCVKIFL